MSLVAFHLFFLKAFDKRDQAEVGAFFSDESEYVNSRGETVRGRVSILNKLNLEMEYMSGFIKVWVYISYCLCNLLSQSSGCCLVC